MSTGVRHRRRAGAVLLACTALGTAACGVPTGSATDPVTPQSPDPRGEPVLDIAAVAGTWRVTSVDGEPLAVRVLLAVRETEDGWWWGGPADECHTTGGPAAIAAGTLTLTASVPLPLNACGPDGQTAAAAGAIQAARGVRMLAGDPVRVVLVRGDAELAELEREIAG